MRVLAQEHNTNGPGQHSNQDVPECSALSNLGIFFWFLLENEKLFGQVLEWKFQGGGGSNEKIFHRVWKSTQVLKTCSRKSKLK